MAKPLTVCLSRGRVLLWLVGAVWQQTATAHRVAGPMTMASLQKELLYLVVDKATITAELKTLPPMDTASKLLHRFRIAFGKEAGDKERQGDNKTPEGIYFAMKHKEAKELLTSKYGHRAIPLNFPNPVDTLNKITGYGIWLHGAGNDDRIADAQVTEGCVAFYNADILKLSSWLLPDQGIIVIANDASRVNLQEDLKTVYAHTLSWLKNWQERDLANYMSWYDEHFQHAGKNKAAYRTYKNQVFNSYRRMEINTELVRVITHPKYAVALMNQAFQGDKRFFSEGRKILYWQKGREGWRIIGEFFDRKRLQPHEYSLVELKKLQDDSLTKVSVSSAASSTL